MSARHPASQMNRHETTHAAVMPFSLPEPPHITPLPLPLPQPPQMFAHGSPHYLKYPPTSARTGGGHHAEPSKAPAYRSRNYPASDIGSSRTHSSQKHARGGSYGALGLAQDLQLLSVTATDDVQSVSTSPSPSPRPPTSPAAPSTTYAPLPQSCLTLPSLRSSCCAASGVFSDASSDFPSSANHPAELSPGRSAAGPPWSGISPRAGAPQSLSSPATMPKACDIRSPRPSCRRPSRQPFWSPPPQQVRTHPRTPDSAPQSVLSSTSSAHEDAMLLKNLQESFTASLESSKVKQHLRRAKPLSARRPGEDISTKANPAGTCSAPASAAGPASVSNASASPASQQALRAAVEKLKSSQQDSRTSREASNPKKATPDRSETKLLMELQQMFAHEIRRKNKARRGV